jgi:hypothetical protein
MNQSIITEMMKQQAVLGLDLGDGQGAIPMLPQRYIQIEYEMPENSEPYIINTQFNEAVATQYGISLLHLIREIEKYETIKHHFIVAT